MTRYTYSRCKDYFPESTVALLDSTECQNTMNFL